MSDRCHMRRQDRRITDDAHIESILGRGRFATFALSDHGEPYVITLSYGYSASSRTLYFHVAHEGHKLDVIASSPRACGTVVIDGGYTQGQCEHPFESVVMRGSMRLLQTAEEKRRAIETLVASLEDDPNGYWASRSWALDERLASFAALAFDIESIDAKEGR